jgi:ADP-ribose pyrophosphatase
MSGKGNGATIHQVTVAPLKMVHMKCRNQKYPRSEIMRFTVPDDKLDWSVSWQSYNPLTHTSDSVIGKPWADPDRDKIPESSWNRLDETMKIDRRSHGTEYKVDEYGPLNPMGRTGLRGRGCLGRWGPNHAADPIVTTWKHDEKGKTVTDEVTKKPVLQFIAIQRRDTKEWAIPGGMVDPGEKVTDTLKREFGEEALNSLETDGRKKKKLMKEIEKFFKGGTEVYRGYVDDPRNTDNAWMETVAMNFHDESGKTVGRFRLQSGDDAVGVKWMDVNRDLKLFASHVDMIREVVRKHGAHW